jgi:hypothetical protein
MKGKGTLRYDFDSERWEVSLDNDTIPYTVSGTGNTPEEAVERLIHQANKHDLWPKE